MNDLHFVPLIKDMTDVEAIESVPLVDRGLAQSTYDIIAKSADEHPDRDALIYLPDIEMTDNVSSVSYKLLHESVAQSARLFLSLSVTRNDVVSILLPNVPQFHFAFWGAEAVAIANPINPLQTAEAIIDLLRAADSKILVALAPAIDAEMGAKVAAIAASIPDLVILTVGASDAGFADFDAARFAHSSSPLERRPYANDIASMFQTGGTTGRPKLARHTHANEVFMAWTFANSLGLTPSSTLLCGLPLFHVNGVFVTGLAPFSRGARVILATPQGYRTRNLISNFWRIVDRYRVTHFSAVPAIISALMDVPVGEADVSSLQFALCGAAPLPGSVMRRFETEFDLTILEGYGLTEATCASALNPPLGNRPVGAVGLRIPYQDIEIRRVDEAGAYSIKCAIDEPGAIFIHGPNVFPGYVDPAATARVLSADGWLNSGDLGHLDAVGNLWLSGRAKDLIIRGGHNIDPEVIEEGLAAHAAVAQVAAVGLPDPRLGELPAAFVVLYSGAQATVEELVKHCADAISERAARPVRIEILSAMPLTAVGKIFKPELRRRLAEEVLQKRLELAGVNGRVRVEVSDRYGLHVLISVADKADEEVALNAASDFPFKLDLVSN